MEKEASVLLVGGCGTIGQRVRDAINLQDDMLVYAIITRSANEKVRTAYRQGNAIYTSEPKEIENFRKFGIEIESTIEDVLDKGGFDIIVDCTEDKNAKDKNGKKIGSGEKNLIERYKPRGLKAILQGGERAEAVETSFNALANYDSAIRKNYVRVVSCNTTGATRLLKVLNDHFIVRYAKGKLNRRGNDPHQKGELPRGSESTIEIDTHQGQDIATVLLDLNYKIKTNAKKSDKQEFHSHEWYFALEKNLSVDDIIDALKTEPRILVLNDSFLFKNDTDIHYWSKELRVRGDVYETIVWPKKAISKTDFFIKEGYPVYELQILVDQQAIVIPETIDCIRAMLGMASKEESMRKTNESLGIPLTRYQLEYRYVVG